MTFGWANWRLAALSSSACVLALTVTNCTPKSDPDPLLERAAFGVFFGGQIQDRKELPFELDPAKQEQGIRLDFRAPLTRGVPIAWEIARPASAKAAKSDAGVEQIVEVGSATARVGESRLDVPISLRQGQVLGTWHVRVKVEARVVIDRDVLVFDPRERREHERDAGHGP
jgi:hypothetical protein